MATSENYSVDLFVFHSFGDVTVNGERLQILIYTLHSWSLSSESSFSMRHLLWQGTSIYNGPLWAPVALTPDVKRLALGVLLPF